MFRICHEATKTRKPKLTFVPSCLRGVSAFAVLTTLATACTTGPVQENDYASKIAAERTAKDATFGASDDPIPRANHDTFLPLAYFPIDPAYNVPASLKAVDDATIIEMPTSAGGVDKFRRVGTLQFVLNGH